MKCVRCKGGSEMRCRGRYGGVEKSVLEFGRGYVGGGMGVRGVWKCGERCGEVCRCERKFGERCGEVSWGVGGKGRERRGKV